MNKSLYLAIIFLLIFSSCNLFNRESESNLNIADTVKKVIAGEDTTSRLIILRDREIPPASNPNLISVDTFKAFGKKYYSLIAEYPNPVYNRFAIIDSYYNVLLMDRSLNGYLKQEVFNVGQIHFIQVEENFISNGVLGLRRSSLYSVGDNGEAELVFRVFTELDEPDITYKQDIIRIDPHEIETKIYSTNGADSKLTRTGEVFPFDSETGTYTGEENSFDYFVLSEVHSYDSETGLPQITSRTSYLRQLGLHPSEMTTEHKLGSFSMPLSDEWYQVKNVKIAEMLNKPMTGTKFINNHYGADISVIKIPEYDSSETYISYPLANVSAGNYRVRFSEKISGGKYFYQFFEYSCGSEKFLLILKTLKTTYDLYKSDYQTLINSFSMDC